MESELDFNEWEAMIGRLILSCSRVEYELMGLYEKYLPERKFHSDSYLDRFDKSIGVAKEKLNNGKAIANLLISMKMIAEYRHLVAHNPIHYSSDTNQFHIFDLKNGKDSVTLEELARLTNAVTETSSFLTYALRVNV